MSLMQTGYMWDILHIDVYQLSSVDESAYVYKSKDVWHTCFASRLHVGHTYQFICGMCGSREIFEMTCCFARADLVWVEDYTQLPYVEHPFWLFLTINSSTPCPHGIIYFCTKFYTWNWAGGIFKMNKNYFTESMQESSIHLPILSCTKLQMQYI